METDKARQHINTFTLTSDGQAFVYGVFGADGYECENLEAVFGTRQDAEEYIAQLRSGPMSNGESAEGVFYGRAEFLTVRALPLRGKQGTE